VRLNSIVFLLGTLVAGFSTVAYSGERESGAGYAPRQVVLKVQPSVSISMQSGRVISSNASLQSALDSMGAIGVIDVFPWDASGTRLSKVYTVFLPESTKVLSAVEAFMKTECVVSAQPNYIITIHAVPNDISFQSEWAMQKVQCTAAWDLFTGDNKTVIAVIDIGVDIEHNDLKANIWTNPDEIPDNGIDDDKNGYVDDDRGWDFCSPWAQDLGFGLDPNDPWITSNIYHREDNNPGMDASDPIDDHGTHVAGIIGAVANNTASGTTNIAGVMWNCKIMALRAGGIWSYAPWDYWLGAEFTVVDLVQAIRYAADNGAHVINMSLGGSYPCGIIDDAIQYAYSKGVVVCASAGNSDTNDKMYPAAFEHVISVAATDKDDVKASFSTYGDWVDISAPGVDILSTLPNNSYGLMSGTSMACPLVSGAAGMVIGYGNSIGKKFSPGQVAYILKQSADDIDDPNPDYKGMLGTGRLNVSAALYTAQYTPSMITLIEIKSADQPTATSITVPELSSHKFKAIAVYTDGTTGDITKQVEWSIRPCQYGRFSAITAGQFNAAQVPENREVVVLASINDRETLITGERVITILEDPKASPLAIEGPDQVDPLSSNAYRAVFQMADGKKVEVTAVSQWDSALGGEYGRPDPAQPGVLMTTGNSGGQEITLHATYTDPSDRRTYEQTKKIVVRNVAQQVAGFFLTSPKQLAAGSNNQLLAQLIYAGQNVAEDVTTLATWSVSPSSAGTFVQAGLFLAGDVTAETPATLTAQYLSNGQVYTASIATKIIPATPSGITITDDTAEDASPGASLPCTLPALAVLCGLCMAGILMSRQD